MAPFMVLLEPEFMVSPATRVGVMGVQFYLFCARERNSLISWILCLHEEDGVGMNTDFQKVFDFNMQVVVNGNLKEDQRYRGSLGRRVWVCGTGDCVLELELRIALFAWILSIWIERASQTSTRSFWVI